VRISIRIGPPLLGHGYMDAVLDNEIGGAVRGPALVRRALRGAEPRKNVTRRDAGHLFGGRPCVGAQEIRVAATRKMIAQLNRLNGASSKGGRGCDPDGQEI
jgi:hypothetical protein